MNHVPIEGPRGASVSFGLILPTAPQGLTVSEASTTSGNTKLGILDSSNAFIEVCRQAEECGADSLWAIDHLYWHGPVLECMTALTLAAVSTTKPTIGSCVLQLPLREPSAIAKQATSIQLLSGGRFILGLGIGSHEGEYAQAGVDYHQRGHLLDSGLETLHSAWASPDNRDERYRQEPPSAPIPIWLGGSSAAARHRAARKADGWVPLFLTPQEYEEALLLLAQDTLAAGRRPVDIEAAVIVFLHVGNNETANERGCKWLSSLYGIPAKAFERHIVSGTAKVCASRVKEYIEAGARHIVTMVADDNPVEHFVDLVDAMKADKYQIADQVEVPV